MAQTIDFFSKFIIKRVEQKLDSFIIVESGSVKGTGKTVYSAQQSKGICKLIDYPYTMFDTDGKKGLMVLDATVEKIKGMVKGLPFGVPIHVDEAVFIAYKRDYQEKWVKKLVKFVNICRKFKKPVFLNAPYFWDLDKDIRNLAEYRITIPKRGIACVRGKYTNPEYEDLWLREESKKIIDKEIGYDFTDLNRVIRGIRKCRNHLFDIIFPDLSKQEYKKYEKKSMAIEGEQIDASDKRDPVILKLLTTLLLENYTPKELEDMINNALRNSYYSEEFSKFTVPRGTLRSWRKYWRGKVVRAMT